LVVFQLVAQDQAIPVILSRASNTVVVAAETGSGKTLAYLLPLLELLLREKKLAEAEVPTADEVCPPSRCPTRVVFAQMREMLIGEGHDESSLPKDFGLGTVRDGDQRRDKFPQVWGCRGVGACVWVSVSVSV
jgi:hypothetical protein